MQPLSENDKGRSPMGPTKILIFGESENTAKIHMSDELSRKFISEKIALGRSRIVLSRSSRDVAE